MALRTGYGLVITVLVFSWIEAYRIQDTASERHIELYRDFVKQDEALSDARRAIWLAGNYVRDFFISPSPQASRRLKSQLQEMTAEGTDAVQRLVEPKPADPTIERVRDGMRDLWSTLLPIPDTMLTASQEEQYAFVQREIVPRREALYVALREIGEGALKALQRREAEFAETRRRAVRRLFLLLGACLILGLFVAWRSVAYADSLERAAAARYEEVRQAKTDLEQLSARLVEIEEEGRKRLARELHDEIGQSLAVLQIELSNALGKADDRGEGKHEHLVRARELAVRTVQTVRNISLLLRPALLDDLGLVPALQWLLEDFMRRSAIACSFTENGIEDQLPDSVKTCVYRVVQEALHNCEKHASASTVSVSLRRSPQSIAVEVVDNGRGFQANVKDVPGGGGLGILGMRERATRIGGTLTVESSPGRGTRVLLSVPAPALETARGPLPIGTEVDV